MVRGGVDGARSVVVGLTLTLAAALTVVAAPAAARPIPYAESRPAADPAAVSPSARPVRVGDVVLEPCDVLTRALCGEIWRRWEPANPDAGRLRIGFALLPARDDTRPVLGTVVPHEGGPGYSTTGSAWGYRRMYGPLLDRRHLLLVDQRGTGLSRPVRCDDLQDLKIAYAVAAGRCGRQLGERADDYTTARSADDTAAVIRRLGLAAVDLYGDSYGTFFQQVFAGRHPGLVRSIVLDSAYPTYGESGWYPTQGPAMRRAFTAACERARPCRVEGRAFLTELRSVLRRVRQQPWSGVSHDADGRRVRVRVNARNLAVVAYGATYAPVFYRELTAALRSGLGGDRAPLLRLVAEATGGGTDAGPVIAYSEGLDAAVACHDYPQLYDMTARPRVREVQLAAAIERRQRVRPRTYGPFTVGEYARSDWEALSWCTRWPAAPPDNPARPPRPPGGYPDVPVLVISGELDSITTAAEGDLVASQFPAARHLVLRNQFHVNASYDYEGCGQALVRQFTRDPTAVLSRCGDRLPPVRALGRFPSDLSDVPPGHSSAPLGARGRRVPPAAALVVADVMDRWWNNYSGHGVGLHGGTWSYGGYATVRFRLRDVELVPGQRVSGTATWDRTAKRVVVDLTVRGSGPDARLRGRWNSRAAGAVAVLHGRVAGRPASVRFLAP